MSMICFCFLLSCNKCRPYETLQLCRVLAGSCLGVGFLRYIINKKTERPVPAVTETPKPIFASAPIYVSPFANMSMQARIFAMQNGYSTNYCFFIDMSIHSGKK